MTAVFQNKFLTFGLLALTLVLVILVSVLLVQLTQLSAFKRQVDYYNKLLEESGEIIDEKTEHLQFIETYEYIYQVAKRYGLMQEGEIIWMETEGSR